MHRGISTSFFFVLLVSLVLSAGMVWAQMTLVPISGTQTGAPIDPGVQWVDDDGVVHIRGKVHASFADGLDINGVPWTSVGYVKNNINMNPATGVGDMSGYCYREYVYGDMEGSLSGRFRATSTAFRWNGTANFPHGTGDFAGWKMAGITFTRAWPEVVTVMEGYFHIPPTKGNDKAAPPEETSTWGSVKALYR